MKERTASKIRIIERRERLQKMFEMYYKIMNCKDCSHQIRAIGYGDLVSPIMLVGQSLHGYCAETPTEQIPFIGPMEVDSGDVLFAGIEKAGSRPEDFWITNLVKCHPPGNRPNLREEEDKCWPFLLEEIQIIKPKHIIALGNSAYNGLYRYGIVKRKVVGKAYHLVRYRSNGQTLLTTRLHKIKHPSWAMRNGPSYEKQWIDVFRILLKECLKGKK